MDYFNVIVLIIVSFIFVSDRKIKEIEELEKQDSEILKKAEELMLNLQIIDTDMQEKNTVNLEEVIINTEKQYTLLKNKWLNLDNELIKTLIANYIISSKKICGFNAVYFNSNENKKVNLKRIYIDGINYLEIFNKQKLDNYGVVIIDKEHLIENNEYMKDIVSFVPGKNIKLKIDCSNLSVDSIKKMCLNKLHKSDIKVILKIMFLILAGSTITANLIYSVFNVLNDVTGFVIAAIIYYCYSYIIRYLYEPIGRKRFAAKYIFPIYFLSYIVVVIYELIKKVINKVHAS